jgi:citrate lyase subunit beta / citryl-CoA lyase
VQPIIARSYLFVPGNRPERFAKAFASGAHAVIIDLEDSVPSSEKTAARTATASWLSRDKPAMVRLNSSTTEWFADDVKLCALPGVAGVVLPKCETPEEIHAVTECSGEGMGILPIIETAQGFWNAPALARTRFVDRLVFGSIDLQLDLGITGDGRELDYFRSQLVTVSRLADLSAPVDGVCTSIHDAEKIRAETLAARRFGFGAKLCIHPNQVPEVNESFLPGPEEVDWARRVLEAAAAGGGAAVALDGKMIDRPIIAKAEAILRQLDRPESTS